MSKLLTTEPPTNSCRITVSLCDPTMQTQTPLHRHSWDHTEQLCLTKFLMNSDIFQDTVQLSKVLTITGTPLRERTRTDHRNRNDHEKNAWSGRPINVDTKMDGLNKVIQMILLFFIACCNMTRFLTSNNVERKKVKKNFYPKL